MASTVDLVDVTGYADTPPAVASVDILDVSAAQPSAPPAGKATVDLLDVSAAQPAPARLEVVWWDGLWRLTDEYLWWEGSWVPAPGNTT